MADSPDKIQWHPAFLAATGLELQEDMEELDLVPEYNLSKKPIRMDLLIIKDGRSGNGIRNEIGHIMKTYNVVEYKSPEDGLSIDDFYKTVGYACLYKGYGKSVNQIRLSELTISLFREAYPKELFFELKREGHVMEEAYPGIYYVTNKLPFPAQVVVTSRLDRDAHSSLRILSRHADREDVERFLEKARKMTSPRERNNVDSVLQVSVSANFELYQELRRDMSMCEALNELMKDEIDKRVSEAQSATKLEDIRRIMHSLNYTAEQTMDMLEMPLGERALYLSKL